VTFDGASLLDFDCDDVSVDYAEVGRLQARHLLQLGRRRICLANTQPEARINAIREAAVRDELKLAGVPEPLEMRVNRPMTQEYVAADPLVESFRGFLAEHIGAFDALIGFDAMVSLAVRVFQKLGVRVPGDVAVVGSGNSMLASYGTLPLTSISTADDTAGVQAFDLLLDRIRGRYAGPFRRLTSPAALIIRESTRE